MATKVQICNLALSHIGQHSIQSLDEATKLAQYCNLHFDNTRDAVLRDHAWGFAKKRLTLALTGDTYSGWDYAYAYPDDCLVAHEIFDLTGSVTGTAYDPDTDTYYSTGKVEFEVSVNNALSQKIILTNKESAELMYTARVTNVGLFDPLFVDALSYALALKLVQPLKADTALRQELSNSYVRLVERAKAVSANETYKKPDRDNDFVNART